MGEGIYQQMQKSNIHSYGELTHKSLIRVLNDLYRGPERKILLDKLNESKFTVEQKVNLKYLIDSELEDDFNIAKEIINN